MSLCLDGKKRLYRREYVASPALVAGDWIRMYGGAIVQVVTPVSKLSYNMPLVRSFGGRGNYYYGHQANRLIGWGPLLGARHAVP